MLIFRVSQYYSTGIIAYDLKHTLALSDPLFDYKIYNSFTSITLFNMLGSFKIFFILWGISLAIFVFEKLVFICVQYLHNFPKLHSIPRKIFAKQPSPRKVCSKIILWKKISTHLSQEQLSSKKFVKRRSSQAWLSG